jgi:RND family efflux transporter MFP subunit
MEAMKYNMFRDFRIASIVFSSIFLIASFSGCVSKAEPAVAVRTVRTEPVRRTDIPVVAEFIGTLKAAHEVSISSKVPGKVSTVKVDIGQTVKRGQLLFSLEKDETSKQVSLVERDYENAKLQFDDAKKMYENFKVLYAQGAISKTQLDDSQLRYNSAEVSLNKANEGIGLAGIQLENTEIRAQVDGVVAERHIEAGEVIGAGIPVLTIVDNSYMTVEIDVPDRIAAAINKHTTVKAQIKSISLEKKGKIIAASPAADKMSGLYTVKIKLDNNKRILKQGMMADISLDMGMRPKVLVVPNRAVLVEDGAEYIFVNENGIARKKAVKVEFSYGAFSEINDVVKEGEQIVVEGQNFLSDGDRIKS